MTDVFRPVQPGQRIWLMDALRGLAILGIFIMNLKGFVFYNEGVPHEGPFFTRYDDEMNFLQHMLLEGKFYSIFSLLFGWGIALQLERGEAKGLSPASFVRRRLTILLLLGLAHLILLWTGDIVAFYALLGFVLLWIRKWSDKTLLITAVVLLLSPILLYFLKMKLGWPAAPSSFLFGEGIRLDSKLSGINSGEEYEKFIHSTNYIGLIKTNISGVLFRYADLFFQSRISKVLGMFILGYLLGRNGRYKSIIANTKLLWVIAISGLAIGLPANYYMAILMKEGGYYQLKQSGFFQTIAYAIGVAPLALAYVALFFLISKNLAGEKIFSTLRPVGKMAFSNYILHSIVGTILFTGVGFALDKQVGPVYYTLLAILVFLIQIVLSHIWLKYFEFGPVEWLWRSATYGKRPGMRK